MGLLDDIQAADSPQPVPCSVAVLMASMPDADAADLAAAMADPGHKHRTIARVLGDHGYDVNEQRIARHRRGLCGCAR